MEPLTVDDLSIRERALVWLSVTLFAAACLAGIVTGQLTSNHGNQPGGQSGAGLSQTSDLVTAGWTQEEALSPAH